MQPNGLVAIVDDEDTVRDALAGLLRSHGMETRAYASPRDFLAALPFGRPDCLIVDMHMPDMTGLELLRELLRRGVHIVTIVITGRDERSYREQCRVLGVAAYLVKPVDPDALIAAIDPCTNPNQQCVDCE
jgi:FixJ family two-component response regulator